MSPDKPVAAQPSPDSVKSQLRLIRPAMTVLFLDPDVAGAERLANTLRSQHRVVVVGSANEALEQVDSRVPDLIVAEIDLPDADGLALVARWHVAPATRHSLLMIVTTRRSVQDKIAGLQAGADDYLVKPVELQQFLAHVAAISRFRRLIHGPFTGPPR
jgi:sigma-B regulation protein RsbU (phosphoserine phosphatase)